MKALNSKILHSIYDAMGDLDIDSITEQKKYDAKSFSVFNIWPKYEEEGQMVFFYENALKKGDTPSTREYYKHHDQFVSFYLDLYKKTKVYGRFSPEYGPHSIIEFDNAEEYKSHVLLSVREQLFLKLILPEFYSVINGNYDLRHLLYTLKSKSNGFQDIASIIKSNGLFILD